MRGKYRRRRIDGWYGGFGRGSGRGRDFGAGRLARSERPLPSSQAAVLFGRCGWWKATIAKRCDLQQQQWRWWRQRFVEAQEQEMQRDAGERVFRRWRPDTSSARFRQESNVRVGEMHKPGFGVHRMLP